MPSELLIDKAQRIKGLTDIIAEEHGYFSQDEDSTIDSQRRSIVCMMENAERLHEVTREMQKQLNREVRENTPQVRVQVVQVEEQRHYQMHVQGDEPLTVLFPEVKRIWPEAVGMLFALRDPQFSVINENGRVVFEGRPQFAKD